MPCERFAASFPDGRPVVGIVCTGRTRRKRCAECGESAPYLCDWKLTGPKAGKTCDRPVCARCATVPVLDGAPAPDRHLCRPHADRWARHPKNAQRETEE